MKDKFSSTTMSQQFFLNLLYQRYCLFMFLEAYVSPIFFPEKRPMSGQDSWSGQENRSRVRLQCLREGQLV